MKSLGSDTIAALTTAPGVSSVAMFRISGDSAFRICDAILKHRKRCDEYSTQTLHRALVTDADDTVDDVMVAVFHAPRSYTGEDTVEITCHGGSVPIRRILSVLIKNGARTADPGEFTLRAYLNGKLDLAQAEAVNDTINARTDEAFRLAQAQQSGKLSTELHDIRLKLISLTALIEATIDFPEDVGDFPEAWCVGELINLRAKLDALIATAGSGMLYRNGISVVLVGEPNVGKSSLLNALLRCDRAIVASIPGTTRDTIEESVSIRGIPVKLVDTAGLRQPADEIEQAGIERTRASMIRADIILRVMDATSDIAAQCSDQDHQAQITVWNKADLLSEGASELPGITVSALTGTGINALENAIADAALAGVGDTGGPSSGAVVIHARHLAALREAKDAIERALNSISQDLPLDFLSIEVQQALTSVGLITGETAPQDIVSEIFHKFCIGK